MKGTEMKDTPLDWRWKNSVVVTRVSTGSDRQAHVHGPYERMKQAVERLEQLREQHGESLWEYDIVRLKS